MKPLKWKKILETNDTIAYEKKKSDIIIRIEARLKNDNIWEIYKIYNPQRENKRNAIRKEINKKRKTLIEKKRNKIDVKRDEDNNVNLIKEYITSSKQEAITLIEKLKEEKDLKLNEIIKIKKDKKSKIVKLDLKREYKEEYVEKWTFSIDNNEHENVIFLRFDEKTAIDVILNEDYLYYEDKIVEDIIERLGVRNINPKIETSIYYFSRKNKRKSIDRNNMEDKILLAKLEMQFNPEDMEKE